MLPVTGSHGLWRELTKITAVFREGNYPAGGNEAKTFRPQQAYSRSMELCGLKPGDAEGP